MPSRVPLDVVSDALQRWCNAMCVVCSVCAHSGLPGPTPFLRHAMGAPTQQIGVCVSPARARKLLPCAFRLQRLLKSCWAKHQQSTLSLPSKAGAGARDSLAIFKILVIIPPDDGSRHVASKTFLRTNASYVIATPLRQSALCFRCCHRSRGMLCFWVWSPGNFPSEHPPVMLPSEGFCVELWIPFMISSGQNPGTACLEHEGIATWGSFAPSNLGITLLALLLDCCKVQACLGQNGSSGPCHGSHV